MNASEPIVRVEGLTTHYGTRRILNNVSLSFQPRETIVLLGSSGTGKSTLLRHILALERPTEGHIYVKGVDVCYATEDELNQLRRRMGVLFQSGALFGSMNLGDNVAVPLRELTKLDETTIQVLVRMKLGLVGLGGFEDLMPSQLSGGMRKRAGLARALALDPEILLFDEPSAGLDPITAAGIDDLILKLKETFPMTIVVVTHELASAFLIADRIAVMFAGEVVALGTPEEIQRSDHPRVQQFLKRVPEEPERDHEAYLRSLTSS
ncbi:MAG: ABC transporter ATP-binding protein [Candidatus Acidiferrales bacterium]